MSDSYNLQRFVTAQNAQWSSIIAELRAGRKRSHWMWFVFPQLKGLGFSESANYFGIGSRAEAEAYLNHQVLGARLVDCTNLVNQGAESSAEQIFGPVDAMKFRSSMTLFADISPEPSVFSTAIQQFFGSPDPKTLALLSHMG